MSTIEEKAALLDLLFEATHDGIVDWDVRTNVANYNERWRFLLGYDNDELPLTPLTWRELVHPEERLSLEEALADHLHAAWPFVQTVRMRHRFAGWHWIAIQGAARRGQDGDVERMVIVFVDVDARLRAENQVRALVEAIPDKILRMRLDGTVLAVKHGKLVSGPPATRAAAQGSIIGALQDSAVREKVMTAISAAASRDEMTVIPSRMTTPEGGEVHNEIRVVRSGEDEAVCIIRDVTREKEAEEHLSRGQKLQAIGQLAAGMAHEINTPIQYIGDNLHFAKEAIPDLLGLVEAYHTAIQESAASAIPATVLAQLSEREATVDVTYLRETLPGALASALEGVAQVSKIVRAMKTLEDVGRQVRVPTDLNALVENATVVATNAWNNAAELILRLDPTLPFVDCVTGEIAQVILNLVANAAQAIADKVGNSGIKGTLVITTSQHGQDVELRVSDDGVGIAESIRPRIFDPFFTTRPVGKGTGQGLAQIHSAVVKLHRGSIRFESQVGMGTTFIVRLPVRTPTVHHDREEGGGSVRPRVS
jgi:PAS domain S-box-containing protein